MGDFLQIRVKEDRKGRKEAYPDWVVGRTKDLMVKGKSFYAIHDPETGLWSKDEYDVVRIVDSKLRMFSEKVPEIDSVRYMEHFSSNAQSQFRKYMSQISDNAHDLDQKLTWADTVVKRTDYASRRLPYSLEDGPCEAWDEITSSLFEPEQRQKFEWAIGAVVAGAARNIEKMIIFYGDPGTGKGTILKIINKLFDGYAATFDAQALGSNGHAFATEAFMDNPIIAIQYDGDLSRIENNAVLNMIVSHEPMTMNAKYKPTYTSRVNSFLFMGTNKAVKITDAKSGLIRRIIDVHPIGVKIPGPRYKSLMKRIDFELGAIAYHCLQVYKELGRHYYDDYQPRAMMYQTNVFYNFIQSKYDEFKEENGVSLKRAYAMYKEFCKEEAGVDKPLPRHVVMGELSSYFDEFHERYTLPNGDPVRSYFYGFKMHPYKTAIETDSGEQQATLILDETVSLLDELLADMPAQYANENGFPSKYWDDQLRDIDGEAKKPRPDQIVSTVLKDLDVYREHYVKVPEKLICIDFDLKGANGQKSLEKNLAAAADFPPTYAELSKSGEGVHLHYFYDGDVQDLARVFDDGIEIKVYTGNSALRRRLSKCNNVPIATIRSGLPLREKKRVLDTAKIKTEKGLRALIGRNLNKEIHPGTKPSIDFIKKILDDAYNDGLVYDVSDMYNDLVAFANNSSNQALACLRTVKAMKLKSEQMDEATVKHFDRAIFGGQNTSLCFYDIEVYPNLFIVCYSFEDSDEVHALINPSASDLELLLSFKLVGFNNRKYDNHILWGAYNGLSNEELYKLSQRIINGAAGATYGLAYGISHTDIYDYSSKKQGLKKFQIEYGLKHKEMDLPWDQPVPENQWMRVVEYCKNDVLSTKEVHKRREGDYKARLILAELSGLTPNHTTQQHTAKIVFGDDREPQLDFVYTDLSQEFPGYVYENGRSTYKGYVTGEGGWVYAQPGIYEDVALIDVASMHPTTIGVLNMFGSYTPRFMQLVNARLALKHKDFAGAKTMLSDTFVRFVEDIERIEDSERQDKEVKYLSDALKIAINIVYGLTSAKFDNPFRHNKNKDNIVAKRGALFMIDLVEYVQGLGYTVVHVKTDSIKIANANKEIVELVQAFASGYGYSMEHEATYEKMCLLNDAVYIAKKSNCIAEEWVAVNEEDKTLYDGIKDIKDPKRWTAVGAQFQHPYIFKSLFGYPDDMTFEDLGETKQVAKGAIYVDYTGAVGGAMAALKQAEKRKVEDDIHDAQAAVREAVEGMAFVGKTGRFVPVKPGFGGGTLYRVYEGKPYAVAGTKDHQWMDVEIARALREENPNLDFIDQDYYDELLMTAERAIGNFLEGTRYDSVAAFVS